MGLIRDTFSLMRSLPKEDLERLEYLQYCLNEKEIKTLTKELKQKKAKLKDLPVSFLNTLIKIEPDNNKLNEKIKEKAYKDFSTRVTSILPNYISPNIIGYDKIKCACAIQLFSTERFHILLLGDPGTGKTDIIRSASELSPIRSFGLGSGASGVGLTLMVRGKEIEVGLLPSADKGIAAIDELNLLKSSDLGNLYNSMEKGFVTYDKGKTHLQLDSRVRLLATANPKGDKFSGNTILTYKKQLPFPPALLSRFNLVFFMLKPNAEQLKNISKNIILDREETLDNRDIDFIRDYVKYTHEKIKSVSINSKYEKLITDFVVKAKNNEEKYLIEISPRTVKGILNMAKGLARMQLRNNVNERDIKTAIEIFKESLKI